MGNNEPGWWIDSWLNYVHQKIMLQYPVMTAAQNRKNGSWTDDPVFITVQDALQVLPEGEMAEKIRKFMRSERGRAFVNAMFILTTMVRGSGMMFLADIFWVVWLLFCIRESKTKAERVIYGCFVVVGVVLFGMNLYGWWTIRR